MNNRLIMPIGILISTVLIILGGYIILGDHKPIESPGNIDINSNNSEDNTYTEPYPENKTGTDSFIPADRVNEIENNPDPIQSANITQNTKPVLLFNIGDKFVHNVPIQIGSECIVEHIIVDKIRVNKTEYFKVQESMPNACVKMIETPNGIMPTFVGPYTETRTYLNVDTGELTYDIGTEHEGTFNGDDPREACGIERGNWFCTWMLKLNDNFKLLLNYKNELDEGSYGGKYDHNIQELTVEGREKIDGRECFKVQREYKTCFKDGSCNIDEKTVYYVDVEKRILVKRDAWLGNLYRGEVKLIDQNVWKTDN